MLGKILKSAFSFGKMSDSDMRGAKTGSSISMYIIGTIILAAPIHIYGGLPEKYALLLGGLLLTRWPYLLIRWMFGILAHVLKKLLNYIIQLGYYIGQRILNKVGKLLQRIWQYNIGKILLTAIGLYGIYYLYLFIF